MDTAQTEKLKALALAATKGPWMRLFGERTVYDRMEDGCRGNAIVRADLAFSMQDANNLDFIAEANPATVLELIADNVELRATADAYRVQHARLVAEVERVTLELQNQRELVQHWKGKAILSADYEDAKRWRFRKQFLASGGAIMFFASGCQLRRAGELVAAGETEEQAIDAAIKKEKA